MTSASTLNFQNDASPGMVRCRALPSWVLDVSGLTGVESVDRCDGPLGIATIHSGAYAIVRARVINASAMNAADLEATVVRAYDAIFEQLSALPAKYPLRLWNYLPGIHDAMGDGRDRYMVFNAGRFRAFEKWYGGRDAFDGSVATASGVGHARQDLWIDCLAADTPCTPVDNPRQIKPYRYSARFGPLPPCFARATIARRASSAPLLLVGGTASIRGEDSVHLGSLEMQTDETFENLVALVRAAREQLAINAADETPQALMQRYRELRVYHPELRHAGALRAAIEAAFPKLRRLEIRRANLCRAELLVEIEGLADLA